MISHERLLELLIYDPATGEFLWRENGRRFAAMAELGAQITMLYTEGLKVIQEDQWERGQTVKWKDRA